VAVFTKQAPCLHGRAGHRLRIGSRFPSGLAVSVPRVDSQQGLVDLLSSGTGGGKIGFDSQVTAAVLPDCTILPDA
jgi:hypothetical protein